MRDNDIRYHDRVVKEFVRALFSKQDCKDEAADVLFSALNLSRKNYTYMPLLKEAQKVVEIDRGLPYKEEAQIITSKDTSFEPSKKRHHIGQPIFHMDDWDKAVEDGNLKALDTMVRRKTAWRHQTIPNANDYSQDEIKTKHHKIHALGLQPNYNDEVGSYSSQPLFHKMIRHLYKNDGENAAKLDKEMKHVAKNLHTSLKADHMFTDWNGEAVNLKSIYQMGFDDFKKDYAEKFPLVDDDDLNPYFLWCKKWEHEGIPREYLFRSAFDKDGRPRTQIADELHKIVKDNQSIQLDDGSFISPDMERIGVDAYRYGIYMLPNDKIREVEKWMIEGADDKELSKIFPEMRKGLDMRGFMAHHTRLMNGALRNAYAGPSLKNSFSHRTGNRYLNDSGEAEMLTNRSQRKKLELEDKMREGKGFEQLKPSVYASLFDSLNINELIDNTGMFVTGEGKYPHYVEDLFGEPEIEMTDEAPNMKSLIQNGFFENNKEALDDIINRSSNTMIQNALTGLKMSTLDDYAFTHKFSDDWIDSKDAKSTLTAQGILSQSLGTHGGLDGDFDDLPQLRESSFPQVYFSKMPDVNMLPIFRGMRDKFKGGARRKNVYEKTGDKIIDAQTRDDLDRALTGSPDKEEKLKEFDSIVFNPKNRRKNSVSIPIDTVNNPAGQTRQALATMNTSYKDMVSEDAQPRSTSLKSLYSFFGHETTYLPSDYEEDIGLLGMDGLPDEIDKISSLPMTQISKLRNRANDSGHDKLYFAEQLHPGELDHTTHDKNKAEDRLLIPLGLFGAHTGIHGEKNEKAIENFKQGNIHHDHHVDPLGQDRDGKNVIHELTGNDMSTPSGNAIYNGEEYSQYLQSSKKLLSDYSIPKPLVRNLSTRRQLLTEIQRLDEEYQNLDDESELKLEWTQKMAKKIKDGEPINGTSVHGTPYTIGPSRASLHLTDKNDILNQMRETRDESKKDMLRARLAQINEQDIERPITSEREHADRKIKHAHQTHGVTEKIFNALKPALERLHPNLFGKEGMSDAKNNQAYIATGYLAHVAEHIALNFSPDEIYNLLNGEAYHGFDGYTKMNQHLSEEDITGLTNMTVPRNRRVDADGFLKIKEGHFGNKQTKGHKLFSKLAEGITGEPIENQSQIQIFNTIIDQVEKAAQNQGISFEDAFMARYAPSQKTKKPREVSRPTLTTDKRRLTDDKRFVNSYAQYLEDNSIVESGLPSNRKGSSYVHNQGGIHAFHDHLLNGGGNVEDEHGASLSLNQESQVVYNMLTHAMKQTQHGSDVGFLGRSIKQGGKMRKLSSIFPTGSSKDKSKMQSLRNLAHILNDETSPITGTVKVDSDDAPVLGNSLDGAKLPPVYTSKLHKYEHGYNCRLPININMDALRDGVMFTETEKHNQSSPSNKRMNLFLPENAMYSLNPNLRPYNPTASNHINYQTWNPSIESNPNTTSGRLAEGAGSLQDSTLLTSLDKVIDDSLLYKEDGKPRPVKFMHRIFDLEDMQHLRGFTGDWVISLYPQGEHVIATKKGKKLSAYNDEGKVELNKILIEEVGRVYEKDFVVHAILHDDMMTIVDLLKTADEDTHNMPTKDRIRHLRAQYESSEHIKLPEPINTKRSDDEGLKVAIEGLRKEGNQDILLRDANATYMKGEPRHPKWVLLSKEKMVDVIVLSRSGKNCTIGVGPLMNPENYGKRAQQLGDEHYMNVGSAKCGRGVKVGDYITVSCTGVSASKNEHPVYRIRSAKATENEPLAADSVETLSILSGDHHVAQSVKMSKGNIVITFAAFDDEVICKTKKEGDYWVVEPQSTVWGNDYLVKLARDQEAYWETSAAVLLYKKKDREDPEYDEVDPEAPAGHTKKPKKVLEDEEELIKRGLELLERGLDNLSKEKITSTGVQGLGIGYASLDSSPKGPTENIRDDTMPDFDPQSRRDDEIKPATSKKKSRLRTSQGETATLEDEGVVAVENSSIDIP